MPAPGTRSPKVLTIRAAVYSRYDKKYTKRGRLRPPTPAQFSAVMRGAEKAGYTFAADGRAVVPFKSMPNSKRNERFNRP